MKLNPDGKTVAAVDLEVPGAGEIMGGSQREEDYDKLVKRMKTALPPRFPLLLLLLSFSIKSVLFLPLPVKLIGFITKNHEN